MALTEVTTTFDLADYFGTDFDARRSKAWSTNTAPSETIHDESTGETRIGSGTATIASDGSGSFTHWAPGVDGNPATWQTYYHFDVPDRQAARGRRRLTLGPFTVTASGELTALVEEQIATPTQSASDYADAADTSATAAAASAAAAASSESAAELAETNAEAAQAAAEAARDDAVDISGISTPDGVVEALVLNTGGAGPLTSAALSATIAAETPAHVDARMVIYRPETYGAVGDGTTTDSAAFTSMIAALVADGGRGTIQLDGTKTYLIGDVKFGTSGTVNVTVEGNGATIKSKATPTVSTLLVGDSSTVGRLQFNNVTFDDNSAGRPAENKEQIALAAFDYVGFYRCRFTNPTYHAVSTYTAGAGDRRVAIDLCTFDGDTTSATGSHLYVNQAGDWTITRSTFSNIGDGTVNGGNQALYIAGCTSLRVSGCIFRNCGQAWDLRVDASGVIISDCEIIGGANGAANSGGQGNITCAANDAVMDNIRIMDSYHPVVLRVSSGTRCTFKNITYRKGANSPAGQRFARLNGSKHRFVSPDIDAQTTTSSVACVFDVSDQPTDIDIIGGVIEGGVRLFRYNTAQATAAARVRGTALRGQVATWVTTASATGSTAVTPFEITSATITQSATLNFGSIAAAASEELTVTVPGAVVGNPVVAGAPAAIEAGLVWNAYVSATDTVKVRVTNITAGAIDPASATWNVAIVK